ncbi:Ig-like domain-containing protein [Evansella tamaricis]|uniref:DNRLRE domain-containing protein n=1 Tax=Evansella tamaricis TaxID=2069301 RepID=A0ABS6JBY1_9BACI|nr:Ig-like domain-containing protein [Evansella tamaricis]MBU9711171.1 DNRLRE domain-containing protein [Evansella tamaricis]
MKKKVAYKVFVSVIIINLVLSMFLPSISIQTHAATRVTEILTERTENTRTFRNSDLTETVDVFPFPVFDQEEATGKWIPRDLTTSVEPQKTITYASEANADVVFTEENIIKFGTDDTGNYQTYINFGRDLPSIENKLFLGATLQLYEQGKSTSPDYNLPRYKDDSYAIHKIMEGWEADQVTWEDQPMISEAAYTQLTDSKYEGDSRFLWDVSSLVQEWYSNPDSNDGLALKSNNDRVDTLRSFYKINNNLSYIPALQISYSNPPSGVKGIGYGLGKNSETGYINLQWHSVAGAKGYQILFYNGNEFEAIDVGTQTTWSTNGKNLWPTEEQMNNGQYNLRLDGSGTSLPDNPSSFYNRAGGTDKNPNRYYFKILAYNDYGHVSSDELAVSIPDQTAPSIPTNVRVTNELQSDFTIEWDESTDNGAGIKEYSVRLNNSSGFEINRVTTTNSIKIDPQYLKLKQPYTISVSARDKSPYSGGNVSAYSEPIEARARLLRDSTVVSFTMPPNGQLLDVMDQPFIRFTIRNEGVADWTRENGYELRAVGHSFVQSLDPNDVIKSGEAKTFEFYLTGEKEVGGLPFFLEMFHLESGRFGDSAGRTLTFSDLKKPEIVISSPTEYDFLKGTISIEGSIKDYDLKSYSLHYGEGSSPSKWSEISFNETATDGVLGSWDTRGIPNGLYTLRVVAVDTSGNQASLDRLVYVNIPPTAPMIDSVANNSVNVTGTAQPGVKITVRQGIHLLGSAMVDDAGNFKVVMSTTQPAGTVLEVTAEDDAGNSSTAVKTTVIDKIPPAKPTINFISNKSTTVTGTGEKNAVIKVLKGTSVLGTTTVKSDGTYSITITKQTAGTVLSVTATDKAGNESSVAKRTVEDRIAPTAPKVNTIGDNSKVLQGTAEKDAVIHVRRGSTLIGTGTANSKGAYSVTIPLQKAGTVLSVTATDKAKNKSPITKKTVVDKSAPATPTVNTVYASHRYIKGKAEKNSYITVKSGKTTLGTARTDKNGFYSVKITPQKRGKVLSITAKDNAGNISKERQTKVK